MHASPCRSSRTVSSRASRWSSPPSPGPSSVARSRTSGRPGRRRQAPRFSSSPTRSACSEGGRPAPWEQVAKEAAMEAPPKNPAAADADASSRGTAPVIPFDSARLDKLMDDAGIDALLVTSKHNVQYLLGGYRFFFFDYMDAIG